MQPRCPQPILQLPPQLLPKVVNPPLCLPTPARGRMSAKAKVAVRLPVRMIVKARIHAKERAVASPKI